MKYLLYSSLFASIGLNLFMMLVSIPHIRRELEHWKRKEEEWSKYWRAYYSIDEQKNTGAGVKDDQTRK